MVSVVAEPETGYDFLEWTGDILTMDNPNSPSTSILMDGDYTIEASFEPDTHTLMISSTEGGTVTFPGEGSFIYDYGETVALEVIAEPGLYFTGWSGDIGTIDDPNSVNTWILINGEYSIEANFDLLPDAYAISWSSVRIHGPAGPFAFALDPLATPDTLSVEPRSGGVRKIVVEFDSPVALQGGGSVAVTDGTDTYSTTSINLADNNYTLEINFDAGVLPDDHCYTIDIAGAIQNLIGDSDCMFGALEGDAFEDGYVNDSDLSVILGYSNMPAAANPRCDLDMDGTILPLDIGVVYDNWLNSLPGY